MVSAIKEICIFMIIGQAILFFVPGEAYMKYVRILVGIIMILRMTQPFLELVVNPQEQQKIMEELTTLEERINGTDVSLEIEDRDMGIYESIEEEIQNRLCTCEHPTYEVQKVVLTGTGGTTEETGDLERVTVYVAPRQMDRSGNIKIELERIVLEEQQEIEIPEKEELRQLYGECIGVDAERIEILPA